MAGNGILYTILIGLLAGAAARFIMPGKQPMGWILTAVLGVAGSLLAGYAASFAGLGSGGFIASVIGAIVLLFVVGKVRGGGSSS